MVPVAVLLASWRSRTTLEVIDGNRAARRSWPVLADGGTRPVLHIEHSRTLPSGSGLSGSSETAEIVTVRSSGAGPTTFVLSAHGEHQAVLVDCTAGADHHLSREMDWDDLGFWAVDVRSSERYVSTQIFNMIESDDFSWRSVLERIHDEDRVVVEHVAARARTMTGPYRLEHRFLVDGRWRHFRHRLQSIAGPDGRPSRIIGVTAELSDVSDRDIGVDLGEGDRRVSLLARGMVHDFKNSLAVIAGHADLAMQRVENGEEVPAEHLSVIRRVAGEAGEVTTRLLHAGRPGHGVTRHIDVRSVLERITPLAQATLGRTAEVSVTIEPSTGRIVADPDRLESALIDVLINARDAMDSSDRRLRLHYEERDLSVEEPIAAEHDLAGGRYGFLSMTDNGSGMDPATLAQAREPMYTTKVAGQGSGLGLTMAVEFARSSGGALLLESARDEGTTVTFVLPVASRQRRRSALRSRSVRVAVIADDAAWAEEVRDHLEPRQQTTVARSHEELDHLLRTEPIDAVLELDQAHRPSIRVWTGAPWTLAEPSSIWTSPSLDGLGELLEQLSDANHVRHGS